MTSVERVKQILKERGIKMAPFEKQCGFSNGYIGKLKEGFPDERLFIVADQLGVDPRWLVFGVSKDSEAETGIQMKYDRLDEHGKRVVDAVMGFELDRMAEEEPEIVTIRHYLYSPAAGVNGLVSGEDYEDIPLPADAPDGADYCLTVSGDSMEPYIHDGQLVYVKEDEELQDFDVGVFFVDGSTYVKQFCRMYNGQIGLLSANPDREDANIYIRSDSTSSLVCLGKVIMKRPPAPQYT